MLQLDENQIIVSKVCNQTITQNVSNLSKLVHPKNQMFQLITLLTPNNNDSHITNEKYIIFATINNEIKTVFITGCDSSILRCQVLQQKVLDFEARPNSVVLSSKAIYILNHDKSRLEYILDIHAVAAKKDENPKILSPENQQEQEDGVYSIHEAVPRFIYFNSSLKNIFNFKGFWYSWDTQGLYRLSLDNDRLTKVENIFDSKIEIVEEVSFTTNYLLVRYFSTLEKKQSSLLVAKSPTKQSGSWLNHTISSTVNNLKHIFEIQKNLVFYEYELEQFLVFRFPDNFQDEAPLIHGDYVSTLNYSSFKEDSQIISVVPVTEGEDNLAMLSQQKNTNGIMGNLIMNKMEIGTLILECPLQNPSWLNKRLKFGVEYGDWQGAPEYVEYDLYFKERVASLDLILFGLLGLVAIMIAVLIVFIIKQVRMVYRSRQLFLRTLKKVDSKQKPSSGKSSQAYEINNWMGVDTSQSLREEIMTDL